MGKNKGKKKSSQEQGESSKALPGVPAEPQPSTSAATTGIKKGSERPKTTSDDQPKFDELTTKSGKGNERAYENQPPGATRNRPDFQSGEHQMKEHYSSGRVSEKFDDQYQPRKDTGDAGDVRYQQKSKEGFRKAGERYQPRGGQQWRGKSQQPRQNRGQEQWHRKDQEQIQGVGPTQRQSGDQLPGRSGQQQWQNRGHQQGHRGGFQSREDRGQRQDKEQWRSKEQQDPRQYQGQTDKGFVGNVWQKRDIPEKEHLGQQQQSPKKAEERPNVWQRKQADRNDSEPKPRFERAPGAPDKVQSPSTSTAHLPPQKATDPSESEAPTKELVPVYKEPGTLARKIIKVQSNHFALKFGDLKEAHHYHVNITEFRRDEPKKSPNEKNGKEKISKNRKIKSKILYEVVRKFIEKHCPDRYPSFDGKNILYTSRPLPNDLHVGLTDTDITVFDDFGKEKTFSVEIKWVKTISLVPETRAGSSHPPMLTKDVIQCIDIVLRNAPIRCFNQIGASFFTKPTDRIIDLGGGMEMYYGFYQSVVMGGRPLLNVHLVHKAFPKNMPVLDAFVEILNSKDRRRTYKYEDLVNLPSWQLKSLNSYIKNLKVAYVIPSFPKVIYRVNELVGSPVQETMIQNGTKKTILEYFRTDKKYSINYPDLPLLWVGNPKGNIRILIPPELCTIEKDQSVKRKLEDFQVSNMIKEAATSTHVHRDNTMKRFHDANYNNSPCVQEFKLSVSNEFQKMDARILETPKLMYGQGAVEVSKGIWQSKRFLVAKSINKWAILNISNDNYVPRKLGDFIKELKNAAKLCGISILSEPVVDEIQSRNRWGPTQADVQRYFENQKPKKYDIIFVIIPSTEQGSSIYSYVKGTSELTVGCLTQCVKSKTVTGRFNMSTAMNILLKVNGKLDGINHTFTEACKPKVLQDVPVMIMGADVTHPPPSSGGPKEMEKPTMPSVAAVIASHDPKAFQYNLCLRLQEPKMEYILDLKAIVKEQLEFFYKKNNGQKPEKIIYFRDGVSEGQFAHVLDIELRAIQDACKEVQKDGYDPAITFLVVQKRHHTRLFPFNNRDSEDQDQKRGDKTIYGNYNVPAGTCVDTTIVSPMTHNFYLVSHASLKGVSRPTKYCTLWDDLNLTSDEIEELSYYLCHMFARCNRSVSYPAPTYYAHLGALRGKAYIKPALDSGRFNMENLQKEMANIQIQFNILNDSPMFFI